MKKTKKIAIYLLLPLIFAINPSYAEDMVQEKVALWPEVQGLVPRQESLPDNFFDNNLFIGLSGVFYPEDNFYEVAREIFQHNYPAYLQANDNPKLATKDLHLIKLQDKLPAGQKLLKWTRDIDLLYRLELCSYYLVDNCITQTINAKDKLLSLLDTNQVLHRHYRDLIVSRRQHSDQLALLAGKNTIGELQVLLNNYRGMNQFVLLTLNHAVLQFADQDDPEAGLENLQLIASMLATLFNDGGQTSMLPITFGVVFQQFLDQFIDALLTAGYLNNYLSDERLIKLVAPHPKSYEEALYHAIVLEQDLAIQNVARQQDIPLSSDKINQLYQLSKRYIDVMREGTFAEKQVFKDDCEQFKELCLLSTSADDYVKRYFTQRNYHNMVYLKYLLLRDPIEDRDIPDFLLSQGDIAIDPITQMAFTWDEKTRAITLPLAQAKYLPSFVRNATLKNPKINRLQVVLKDELLPELNKLMQPKSLTPKQLENNLFIALLGAHYPHDDYYDVAQQALLESYEALLTESPATHADPLKILNNALAKLWGTEGSQWQGDWHELGKNLSCYEDVNQDCLAKTLQNKALIAELRQGNRFLLERYNDIFAKYSTEHWITLPRENAIIVLPWFQDLLKISALDLAQGVIDIAQGEVDSGMAQFIMWQKNINQLVSKERSGGMVGVGVALTMQQLLDEYVNGLLNSDYVLKIADRLPELFDLQLIYGDTVRAQALAAFEFDSITSAFDAYAPLLAIEAQLIANQRAKGMVLTTEEVLNALTHLEFSKERYGLALADSEKLTALLLANVGESNVKPVKRFRPQYKKDDYASYFAIQYPLSKTLNRYYARLHTLGQLLKLEPYSTKTAEFATSLCEGILHNAVLVRCQSIANALDDLKQVDRQRSYHTMLYLKYLILRDHIEDKDIPEFLEKQGELTFDPLTQKAFVWDEEKRVIVSPSIDDVEGIQDAEGEGTINAG